MGALSAYLGATTSVEVGSQIFISSNTHGHLSPATHYGAADRLLPVTLTEHYLHIHIIVGAWGEMCPLPARCTVLGLN